MNRATQPKGLDLKSPIRRACPDLGKWEAIEGLDQLRERATIRRACGDCKGEKATTCGICRGSGEAVASDRFVCSTCSGSGVERCESCDASGEVEISISDALSWPTDRRDLARLIVERLGDVAGDDLEDLLQGSDDALTIGILLARMLHASGAQDSGVDFAAE